MMQQSAAIELDNLHEAGEDEEVSHDAPDSFPGPENDTVESSSTHNNTAQNNDGEKAAKVHSQMSLAAAKFIATWAGAAVGFGALAVAVYYGYWSLRLQRWTAIKDFREQCQGAMVNNVSTIDCIEALSSPPVPPPVLKSLAQRMYNCVTFQDGCTQASGPHPSLSSRSVQNDRKPWWLVLLQTLVLTISVFGLHWLGSLPPNVLRSAVQRYLGDRGFKFLRLLRVMTYETFVLLSCFSPLYALWFWWIYRKRMDIFSVAGLTCFGGAFTAFYVYGSRRAWRAQRESAEGSWRSDPQSIEQQVWTRPDGVLVAALGSDRPPGNVLAISSTTEFQTGPRRRHR